MPIIIYLYGLAFFVLGVMLFFGVVYGCRFIGRKISDRKEKLE